MTVKQEKSMLTWLIFRHTYIRNPLPVGADIKTVPHPADHERAKIAPNIYAHLTYNHSKEILLYYL